MAFSDIVRRNQVRKIDQLERVVRYTFSNVGNIFSAKPIADYLKSERRALDNETVNSNLKKLEKAYLLHRCSRYDLQGREILKIQEQFYLADIALRHSVLCYQADSTAACLENVVYLELCRRGYTVYVGKSGDSKIDFVAVRQNKKLMFRLRRRSVLKGLKSGSMIACWEYTIIIPNMLLRQINLPEGIKTMHIADFLLSSEYYNYDECLDSR